MDNPVVDLKLSQVMQWIIADGRQGSRVVTGVTVISGVIRDMKCNHFRCSIIQVVVD